MPSKKGSEAAKRKPAVRTASKKKPAVRLPVEQEDQRTLGETEEAERKVHLDAYYKKKLLYLEEKSRMIDRLRRKQEQEDLQYMAAVPKIGERSRKLAELYRLRQKLIEDDLFLRKTYDRENSRFEIAPNPHYALETKRAHSPLPAFRLAEDSDYSRSAKRSASNKKQTASSRPGFERASAFRALDPQQLDRHNFYEREKQFIAKKSSNGHLKKTIDQEKKLERSSPSQQAERGLRQAKSQARIRKQEESEEKYRGPIAVSPEPLPPPRSSKKSREKSRIFLNTSTSKSRKGAQASEQVRGADGPETNLGRKRDSGAKPAIAKVEFAPLRPAVEFLAAEPRPTLLKSPATPAKKQAPISPLASPANGASSTKKGEFFPLKEEDRASLSPSIENYRKESHFLSPEEIIRNNNQLMKKSRPKQPMKALN